MPVRLGGSSGGGIHRDIGALLRREPGDPLRRVQRDHRGGDGAWGHRCDGCAGDAETYFAILRSRCPW